MSTNRGNFGSRFVVVMALAGSAIGLGNIWRFPYMVGEHGGAAFIILYIVCSLFIALPAFFAESIIGKATGSDTFGALSSITGGSKVRNAGYVSLLASFVIVSFYSVVGGWSVDYFGRSLFIGFGGDSIEDARQTFSLMSSSTFELLACTFIFITLSSLIVLGGVKKGIGLFSKVSMPLLFIMILLIAIESLRLPGAKAGVDYLIKPDWSKLDGPTVAAALGQAFFSLSLGVGTVLTYSSYMRKEENIMHTGMWTALFDTLFAILAGFAIMPAVFASGIEPGSGPSLVFETLPVIFSRMGWLVPVLFFLSILIAALSSAISLLETVVAWLVDEKKLSRRHAVLLVYVCSTALAFVCALAPRVFAAIDFFSSNVLMMLGALVFVMVVGWKMGKPEVRKQFTNYGTSRSSARLFPVVYFLIRYVAPLSILAIAVTNFL